jgi:hypothetical protein
MMLLPPQLLLLLLLLPLLLRTSENAAADGHVASEWALLVDVVACAAQQHTAAQHAWSEQNL